MGDLYKQAFRKVKIRLINAWEGLIIKLMKNNLSAILFA